MPSHQQQLFERDFVMLLTKGLSHSHDFVDVEVEPAIDRVHRPDIIARSSSGKLTVFEVKSRAPQTRERLDMVIKQLREYAEAIQKVRRETPTLVLVTPDAVLTPDWQRALRLEGIEVWDRSVLQSELGRVPPDSLDSEEQAALRRFVFGSHGATQSRLTKGQQLRNELTTLPCGQDHWPRYQRLVTEILAYLFCPPLADPLHESRNASGVNRRDIILANYVHDGFWGFLYRAYRAEYIVVDAKNYCKGISKAHVLQLANYLSEAGTGLLGIIVTRKDEGGAALVTRREQWLIHRKMIIVIADVDLHQMLDNRGAGLDAEELLRQKIQDFRLAV